MTTYTIIHTGTYVSRRAVANIIWKPGKDIHTGIHMYIHVYVYLTNAELASFSQQRPACVRELVKLTNCEFTKNLPQQC